MQPIQIVIQRRPRLAQAPTHPQAQLIQRTLANNVRIFVRILGGGRFVWDTCENRASPSVCTSCFEPMVDAHRSYQESVQNPLKNPYKIRTRIRTKSVQNPYKNPYKIRTTSEQNPNKIRTKSVQRRPAKGNGLCGEIHDGVSGKIKQDYWTFNILSVQHAFATLFCIISTKRFAPENQNVPTDVYCGGR